MGKIATDSGGNASFKHFEEKGEVETDQTVSNITQRKVIFVLERLMSVALRVR